MFLVFRVRSGKGPVFLEFMTFRWRGHFEAPGMPDLRPPEEIEAWKKKCPVASLEHMLIDKGIVTRQTLDEINSQVMQQIENAVSYALASPFPDPQDALEDVFSA